MLNVTVKKEIISQMGQLDYEHQKRVLDFARTLAVTGPNRLSGKLLLPFGGTYADDDLREMKKIIEDHCEKIDQNE